MKERERVLELVQKGIISTEEALVLLENMATEKDEKLVSKEAKQMKVPQPVKPVKPEEQKAPSAPDIQSVMSDDESIEADISAVEAEVAEKERQDRERLEKILDELATEANLTSVQLDEVNEQLKEAKILLKEKQEAVMVFDTMEELETDTVEYQEERDKAAVEMEAAAQSIEELEHERKALEEKLKNIRKEQKEEKEENNWSNKFEIPDDWKETASETFTQVGEKMSEAGSQLGRFLKKTIGTVVDSVNDNVDWKEVNMKVPGLASTKFEHDFYYPATIASIIDVKVANGEVKFKTWEKDDIKIEAAIKLYGKMDAETPLEAFLERSQIEVDDERVSFQVPNKRIRADLVFYLPVRMYDHVAVKMLNGDIEVQELNMKDFYGKSTNGDIKFNQVNATMIELEGVNGDMEITNSKVMDFLAETVNGDFTVKADVENIHISSVNGSVKITVGDLNLNKIDATLVNGTIKVAIPQAVGLEGIAKLNIGSIKNRLTEYEVIREKKDKANQLLQFRRTSETQMAHINLTTTTGSIYLKDTDQ